MLFEIHIPDTNTSGTIPITWCGDKELLADLADSGVMDPQVVICIAPVNNYHIKKEVRKVVPLKELMTYVELQCSGENRIYAFVSYRDKKEARNWYLLRSNGSYDSSILMEDGLDYRKEIVAEAAPISVNVPSEHFAKEPSEFEKRYVNHFFRNKPLDQCDFRKRRLFAYTIQPLVLFFIAIPRIAALLLAALIADAGFFEVLKRLFSPLTHTIETTWGALKGSVLVRTYPGESDDTRASYDRPMLLIKIIGKKFYLLPFMPGSLLGAYLLSTHHHLLFGVFVAAGAVIAMAFILLLTTSLLSKNNWFQRFIAWGEAFLFPVPSEAWYQNEDVQSMLICSPYEKREVAIKAIPKKYRSVRLRFEGLKASVCRPFSR